MIGITEDGIADELPQSTNELHFFDIGTKNYAEVSGKEIEQRNALVSAIKKKERDIQNYKEAFRYLIEEVDFRINDEMYTDDGKIQRWRQL